MRAPSVRSLLAAFPSLERENARLIRRLAKDAKAWLAAWDEARAALAEVDAVASRRPS